MRAEDLFEAMGALDEQLIALSEEDSRRAREAESGSACKEANKRKAKMRKRAEIYRFAAVAMTTAAAVFIVLTARDLLGARSNSYMQSAAESAEYSADEGAAEEAAQDTMAGGAAELQAEPSAAEPDAGTLSKYSAAQDADAAAEEAAADAAEEEKDVEEAAESEAQKDAGYANADRSMKEVSAAEAAGEPGENAEAGDPAKDREEADGRGPAEDAAAEDTPAAQGAEKSAVDILGDLKGDYVKLEIITAEDRANGGQRTVPEYTEEREKALTEALEDGQKMPAMFVRIGHPVGYVYLTDSTGKEDTVTFYENGYVGISTIPSFVMKLSSESFEDVMELFR